MQSTVKSINFAGIQEQEFMSIYEHTKLTDVLNEKFGVRTNMNLITKQKT